MGTPTRRPPGALRPVLALTAASLVAAAAPLPPDATESAALPFDPWLIAAPVIVLGAIAVAWRWPGTRRRIAALAILVAAIGVAMYALLLGALSTDTSGDVPLPALVVAVASAGAGVVGACMVAFRRPRPQR